MERFVHHANIRHYRKLLAEEQDAEKRNMIRKLLAEEEAKEALKSNPNNGEDTKPSLRS